METPKETKMTQPYEQPQVKDLGSLTDLTLQNKDYGLSDGFLFQGDPIMNVS
jgi:hypothetical protein